MQYNLYIYIYKLQYKLRRNVKSYKVMQKVKLKLFTNYLNVVLKSKIYITTSINTT